MVELENHGWPDIKSAFETMLFTGNFNFADERKEDMNTKNKSKICSVDLC